MTGGIITTHPVEQLDAVALAWLSLAAHVEDENGDGRGAQECNANTCFYEGSRDELVPLRCLQQ